jgi:hypothetical protein
MVVSPELVMNLGHVLMNTRIGETVRNLSAVGTVLSDVFLCHYKNNASILVIRQLLDSLSALNGDYYYRMGRASGRMVALGMGIGIAISGIGITVGSQPVALLAALAGGFTGGLSASISISIEVVDAAMLAYGALVVAAVIANELSDHLLSDLIGGNNSTGNGITPANYREKYYEAYPDAPRENYQIHHLIPQKARNIGLFTSDEVDTLENLRAVPTQIHQQINREWQQFWQTHPGASRQDVFDFVEFINNRYGQEFWNP